MWSNIQRYIFGLLGIVAMVGLVMADKVYPTGQPVPSRAYLIVGVFVGGCMVWADNLTSIIMIFIRKFTGKDEKGG